ncbi:hypothetical protein QE374_002735 [Microbacterium sp. SORGH_AS428]|uniref:DUF7882 family protein n=1 Tax=Microbacterium sp. SORGH_AS_0428 TaxID=3041788 RepID=UPI002866F931|nr:hypothetical protein [Microbacterium sp. SORGH_AS_0428]MDR6200826.1 hypothetical protein [Microbacterium sp. SORGH_AS_0428]
MGQLYYANATAPVEMNDRLLAHVKVVATTKLRRQESFTLNLRGADGRETLWIHSSIPLRFVFSSAEPESLNPVFLQSLAESASSTAGLTVDLDDEVPAAQQQPRRRAA